MGLRSPSSLVWNSVQPIPYSEASVSTEYGKSGFGSASIGEEQIESMNVWKEVSCSSFSSNLSGAPFLRSSLRGWAVIAKFLMKRR